MQASKLVTLLVALVLLPDGAVYGANILALMGLVSPSHHIWNSVLLYELAVRGHNVTILSVDLPRANEKVPTNVHYIHLEKAYDIYKSEDTGKKLDITQYIGLGAFESIPKFYDYGLKIVRFIYESQGIQQLLAYPTNFKFDVIINDYTLGAYMLGFAYRFNYPPIVGITAFHNPPNTIDFMSNHYFPAYTPYHSTSYGARMNFWERFHNTLVFAADTLYRHVYYVPLIDEIMRSHFGPDMPHVSELARLTTVSLVNSHPAIDYVEPLPPSVIEIGGMQIQAPKPLPELLDKFMSSGSKGAIFFSLGTNMKSQDMSMQSIKIILQTFANLTDYNFLWKFEAKYLGSEKLPTNVMIAPFFPQRDVLAHPKIKAFVTHCGGLSSQEATWRGVPMVGIPLFFEQYRNLRQSLLAGSAVKVDYLTMTTETLTEAIRHVAEDVTMLENVKKRSRQFRDTPMKPLETAVWWVEYLLREPKPSHLKSVASELNFFAAHSLDILAAMLLLVVLGLALLRQLLCVSYRRNTHRRSRNHRKSD